jgi:hypothetical protein
MSAPTSDTDALLRAVASLEGGIGPFARTHLAAATGADATRFLASTNMKVGAYTVANSGAMPTEGARHVTVTHTTVAGADTLGVITVTGTDLRGAVISEDIVPLAGTVATGLLWFATVTALVGSGWVATSTADTITIGVAAGIIAVAGAGTLHSVVVNTAAAGAVTLTDANGTIAILKSSIAEGVYVYDVAFTGNLGVTAAAATDVTIVRTAQA